MIFCGIRGIAPDWFGLHSTNSATEYAFLYLTEKLLGQECRKAPIWHGSFSIVYQWSRNCMTECSIFFAYYTNLQISNINESTLIPSKTKILIAFKILCMTIRCHQQSIRVFFAAKEENICWKTEQKKSFEDEKGPK